VTPSASAASIAPELHASSGTVASADDVTTFADLPAVERQLASSGNCSHPIRLQGRTVAVDLVTGASASVYETSSEPGGVLHVACGNRRESACPACSAVYKRDARQLVRAGLIGGKGIPESVAGHPCVFATFTAPGFGPVHARRERGGKVLPCRPRRDASKRACPHGRDVSCSTRHSPDDSRLGRPMCPDCYDYEGSVLFNAGAGMLWRRFTTYLPRHLARLAGIRVGECRELVKPVFVKVAEYQARGVVHFHAVIRLDANVKDAVVPPGPGWTADLLRAAVPLAARQASALVPFGKAGHGVLVRFGAQTDVRVIHAEAIGELTRAAVANYVAKYATKVSDVPGLPNSRIRHVSEIPSLRCPAHHKRLIATALSLGFGKWAHMLGYGGHFLTKSRRYSVTFGQLRRARAEHRKMQRWPDGELDPWGRPLDERVVLVLSDFTYAGTGYTASDSHSLALMSADSARKPSRLPAIEFLSLFQRPEAR
jgi:hypothetical protein